MKTYLVRVEEASGMDLNPRKYKIKAKSKSEAMCKVLLKEEYSKEDIKEMLKSKEEAGESGGYLTLDQARFYLKKYKEFGTDRMIIVKGVH